jgi:hypothetical protein
MKTQILLTILLCSLAGGSLARAGEKKAPQGSAEDESVMVTAIVLTPEQLRQAVGSDFDNNYIVLDVRLAPKGGKPYTVHLEDFILRSEQTGEHGGPFTNAGQIAGAGALVVARTYGDKSNPDTQRQITGTKLEMKNDDKADAAHDAVKQKMLTEKTVTEPVSGLLFFPLSKEKTKNLVLSYKTPQSKMRLSFK